MLIRENEIARLERRYRMNLINSITGIKPANLIGTRSEDEQDNVAIFSSVVHLGSDPALIGMVTRPQTTQLKDTYSNIMETGFYTINHVSESFIKKAHYTSAKLGKQRSEFDTMKIEREFVDDFFAPFVMASPVKVGMRYLQSQELPNGCSLIIGQVEMIKLSEQWVDEHGHLDMESYNGVGISGLNSYYSLRKIAEFPYAKLDNLPDFHE